MLMLAPWMVSLVHYCASVQFAQGGVLSSFVQSVVDCSRNAGVAKQALSSASSLVSKDLDYTFT